MSRLLTVALLVMCSPAVKAADDPKDILNKAIKAHGGEEFLTKYKAATGKERGKINLMGNETEYTDESAFMLPDKFKQVLEFDVMGMKFVMTALINGDNISVEGTIAGMKLDLGDDTKAVYKDVPHLLRVGQLVPLKDKSYTLELIGEDKVDEKKVVGVRVTKKDQKDISLFFDKQTWLMVKMEYRTKDQNGNEVNEARIVKEYAKDMDGIPYPKKVVVTHDGKTFLESEALEHKYLEKLDDSEFKK